MLYSKMAKKWIYIPTIFLCIMLLFLASMSYAENSNITLSMNGYKQTTSYTCGSASSLMVLYYCGQREALETSGIKRDEDFHNTYRVDKRTKGIQMADIAKGINNFLGQDTYSIDYYVASVDDLINTVTNSLKLYRPVIASVYWYGGHYVVIYGIYYENGTAYFKIKDPAKTADQVITKKATEFYNSMPYPGSNGHPILYGTTKLNYEPILNISGATYPSGKIIANQSVELKGKITSNETITAVYGAIYYLKDNTLVPKTVFSTKTNPAKITPNKTSIEINNTAINTGLKFGQLPEEAYRYELSAVTSSGYSKILVDSVFTVGSYVLSTGVTLDKSSVSLDLGKTISLTASISPSNATKDTLLWYSKDPAIATVDSNGKVTGVSSGVTDIIAETCDGSNVSACCTVSVKQKTGKWGDLIWSIDDNGALTISGTGIMNSFSPWDQESAWRPYSSEITEVNIQPGITCIGDYAFWGCEKLENIILPNEILLLGRCSFYGCSELNSITLPNCLVSIDSNAFAQCKKITGVEIPSSVEAIKESAFEGCSALKALKISNKVSYISNSAFAAANDVKFYCYEDSYAHQYAYKNRISYYLLDTPQSKPDFIMPAGLESIEDEAFSGIKAKRIKLNNEVRTIGEKAFSDCTDLIQIYIPATCTNITPSAFTGIKKLIIFGELGSYAETFAKNNGIPFATSDSLSIRIRTYILDSSFAYDENLDINGDGSVTSLDYVIARKAGL